MSVYLISIARAARKAAEDARSAEKVRTALHELERAAEKNTQIGHSARAQSWAVVQIKAEEVMTCCYSTIARWKDDAAFKDSSNDLLMTATFMRSIVLEANKPNARVANILKAQIDSSQKLSAVVGQVQKQRDSEKK